MKVSVYRASIAARVPLSVLPFQLGLMPTGLVRVQYQIVALGHIHLLVLQSVQIAMQGSTQVPVRVAAQTVLPAHTLAKRLQ